MSRRIGGRLQAVRVIPGLSAEKRDRRLQEARRFATAAAIRKEVRGRCGKSARAVSPGRPRWFYWFRKELPEDDLATFAPESGARLTSRERQGLDLPLSDRSRVVIGPQAGGR